MRQIWRNDLAMILEYPARRTASKGNSYPSTNINPPNVSTAYCNRQVRPASSYRGSCRDQGLHSQIADKYKHAQPTRSD